MSQPKSKCPFAAFSAFGRKITGHDATKVAPSNPAGLDPAQDSQAPPAASSAAGTITDPEEELLAYRTLLRHASVVRGARGNLLVLPSISLPSGDLADAPAAIRSWLTKVPPANRTP